MKNKKIKILTGLTTLVFAGLLTYQTVCMSNRFGIINLAFLTILTALVCLVIKSSNPKSQENKKKIGFGIGHNLFYRNNSRAGLRYGHPRSIFVRKQTLEKTYKFSRGHYFFDRNFRRNTLRYSKQRPENHCRKATDRKQRTFLQI